MEKWMEEITPIMEVADDCIVSYQGCISIVFKIDLPEIFTSSDADFENLHQCWIKALRVLPAQSVLHKQDWFIKDEIKMVADDSDGFLAGSSARYFNGRSYLSHSSYVIITKMPDDKHASTSLMSGLIRGVVPHQLVDSKHLVAFENVAGQFASILENGGIGVQRLKNAALQSSKHRTGFIEQYYQLSQAETPLLKDIAFDTGLTVGDNHCDLYTLSDVDDLPALCGSRITFEKFSTDKTKFPVGFPASISLLLDCNHIYNQYVFISDSRQVKKKLEAKRLRLRSLAAYSRENLIAHYAVNDYLNIMSADGLTPVRAHYNLLVWDTDKSALAGIRNKVVTALAKMDATAKLETVGHPQIWWAGIPGNAGDLPENETFLCFGEQAVCFFNVETNYKSCDKNKGFRFADRQSNKPFYLDLYHDVRKKGITQNFGTLVCGASGGGKSMTVNHLLSTLFVQDAHIVVVDIGGSYRGLCELCGGYYFQYEEANPIQFNPFYLPDGQVLDTEKKESLKALLIALWKQDSDSFARTEYVALSNAIQGYYTKLANDTSVFPCFNTFYEYLRDEYVNEVARHKLKDRDFDFDNFLYVLHIYYEGGEFDYLLNARTNLDIFNQRFTVIEMDNLKDHPILFKVITLIVIELFISKMRKLKGVLKAFCIDEAWKAITNKGMAEFVQYAWKTFRKFNAIPIVVTQEVLDLISNPIIKETIIVNSDIKVFMDMKKFMNKFDLIQTTMGFSEKSKTLLLSVNKDDREVFFDIGGVITKVCRNELCPEEYYAYTTEGKERVQVLEYAEHYGSMEAGITALLTDLKLKK